MDEVFKKIKYLILNSVQTKLCMKHIDSFSVGRNRMDAHLTFNKSNWPQVDILQTYRKGRKRQYQKINNFMCHTEHNTTALITFAYIICIIGYVGC